MYTYEATRLNVVDGDTVDLEVSLGLDQYSRVRLRLYGIDTAEMSDKDPAKREQAALAKQFLLDRLPTTWKHLRIATNKDHKDKYGRYLVTIYVGDDEKSINEQLVDAGLAVSYMGFGPRI